MTLSTSVHDARHSQRPPQQMGSDHAGIHDPRADRSGSDPSPGGSSGSSVLRAPAVWRYLAATVLVSLVGVIYQLFSHGVRSDFMTFAYVIPLLLGVVPAAALHGWRLRATRRCERAASTGHQYATELPQQIGASTGTGWGSALWGCGLATLTVGSLLQGALQIYGTTSGWIGWYLWVGLLLSATAVPIWWWELKAALK